MIHFILSTPSNSYIHTLWYMKVNSPFILYDQAWPSIFWGKGKLFNSLTLLSHTLTAWLTQLLPLLLSRNNLYPSSSFRILSRLLNGPYQTGVSPFKKLAATMLLSVTCNDEHVDKTALSQSLRRWWRWWWEIFTQVVSESKLTNLCWGVWSKQINGLSYKGDYGMMTRKMKETILLSTPLPPPPPHSCLLSSSMPLWSRSESSSWVWRGEVDIIACWKLEITQNLMW